MKFSIIIPVYNSAAVIQRCLDSVVNQTCQDFEVLVMDGKSVDNTIELVLAYGSDRIRLFSEPDRGVYDAMNKGIDKSQGEWLYFLGSDDYLLDEQVLEKVSEYLDDLYHIVYGEVESQLPDIYRGEWCLEKMKRNRCHQAIFYNKKFFADGLRYDLRYKILADYDINLRWFLMTHKYKHKYMPVVVAHFSTTGLSSRNRDEVFNADKYGIMLKYGRHSLSPKYKKRLWRLRLDESGKSGGIKVKYKFHIAYNAFLQKIQERLGMDQEVLY